MSIRKKSNKNDGRCGKSHNPIVAPATHSSQADADARFLRWAGLVGVDVRLAVDLIAAKAGPAVKQPARLSITPTAKGGRSINHREAA
ncbi:hypothetical protein LCGC14_0017270 [marine sediment metagenome]|uniref:Uncharacterized protein n=1 Tax=marine sediment metagenome TaxID=412755 RepID=A0A0F9W4G3_9ZZZZ|nr:hypothetical protein [Phycisphaerae bacterium]HDZ42432.1 hypothetical protein [Phycisphaerae bacterium]